VIVALALVACALQGPGPGSKLPNLARSADGETYLSWVEEEDGRASLHVARRKAGKEPWGDAMEIASGEDWFVNWADFPSVSALAGGTLMAHWLEKLGDGTYAYGIRIVLSKDGGSTWSEPIWLHDDHSAVEHGFASLVPLDGDTFGAVWLDGRNTDGHGGGAMALYYRTISADGELGEEVLLDERVCDCCPTSLVRTPEGVLFAAYRDRSEEEIRDIYFVRFDEGWTAPAPVHADGWEMPGCPVNGPRLAVAEDVVTVAWYTGAGGGAGRVLVSFLEGDAFGEPVQVDEGAPIGRVDVVTAGSDQVLVTWLEHAGTSGQWRARHAQRNGRILDSRLIEEVDSSRSSGHLRMVRFSADSAVMALTDGRGVSTRRFEGTF